MIIEVRSLGESDPTMRMLIEAVQSNPTAHRLLETWNGELGNPQNPAIWLQEVLVAPFLRHYVARFSSTGYLQRNFDAIFEHVAEAVLTNEVQVEIVSPLQGFRADVTGEVELPKGFALSGLPTEKDRRSGNGLVSLRSDARL